MLHYRFLALQWSVKPGTAAVSQANPCILLLARGYEIRDRAQHATPDHHAMSCFDLLLQVPG